MPDEHIRFLDSLAAAIAAGDNEAKVGLPMFEPWLRRLLLCNVAPIRRSDPTLGANARLLALCVLTDGHA
jgi:hypothetical protein